MDDHWNVPVFNYDPTGRYEQRRRRIENPFYSNRVKVDWCDHVHNGKHSSELFCECASSWLEQYNHEAPFFIYISLMAPHDPRSMPDEFLSKYNPDDIKLPDNFLPEHHFHYGIQNIRDEVLSAYPRSPEEIKKHIAEYYGMISHLDNEFGKVIQTLKNTEQYDNTIIVFAGDNGLAVGQHGLMGKQSCYEHSIRVPLIFSGPGIPRNEQRGTFSYLMDIYPTLCDLTGIDIPYTVEGKSLVPAIADENKKTRETLYFAYADLIRSVKDERYKLIEYRNEGLSKTQLFDLEKDPNEINNLYGEEGYEKIAAKLQKELIRFRNEWDDTIHPVGSRFWGMDQ